MDVRDGGIHCGVLTYVHRKIKKALKSDPLRF